jgi:hypothetical protein
MPGGESPEPGLGVGCGFGVIGNASVLAARGEEVGSESVGRGVGGMDGLGMGVHAGMGRMVFFAAQYCACSTVSVSATVVE